ncbi:hypothetical protein GOP47_0024482 [Adiantum capillus-veneris]|uniref:Threonylcarbamoyl-AMP synthase n=1 Tax=Adiantum capillus-veneris TaxID=13818 RepID=A0A9D4U2C9_ADICA|nr:hypothetical protein GOP47_0024482 [Adiantum capillus-veneris]
MGGHNQSGSCNKNLKHSSSRWNLEEAKQQSCILCLCAKGNSKLLCRSMSRAAVLTTRALEGEAGTLSPQVLPALPEHVDAAVLALRKGLVIAVPTDTLYGFAADACCEEAITKIYSIKGRNSSNPLAVCLAHPDDFEKYSVTNCLPDGLLKDLFPGPVTAVLLRGDQSLLSKRLNPGICSIGIRIPKSAFIMQLAEAFGGALALTSANVSGKSSTIRIQEFESLWPYCAAVFDAGEIPSTREGSTIVDLTVPRVYKILRTGSALDSTVAVLERHGLTEAASTSKGS